MTYEPVRLAQGEEWLWRPFMRGKCTYLECIDGTLDLADIAQMNDLLDVMEENDARAEAAREAASRR